MKINFKPNQRILNDKSAVENYKFEELLRLVLKEKRTLRKKSWNVWIYFAEKTILNAVFTFYFK